MGDLHVACAMEGDYVAHSAAMLHSLLVSTADASVNIHYLHGPDFAAADESLIAEMVESNGGAISFVSVPDELCMGLPTEGFTGKATWYRVLVPRLFENLDRLLFLDLDQRLQFPQMMRVAQRVQHPGNRVVRLPVVMHDDAGDVRQQAAALG